MTVLKARATRATEIEKEPATDSDHEYRQGYELLLLHPAEKKLILYLRQLGYGRLEIKVHSGLPEGAEVVRQRVRFKEPDASSASSGE